MWDLNGIYIAYISAALRVDRVSIFLCVKYDVFFFFDCILPYTYKHPKLLQCPLIVRSYSPSQV